MSAMSEMSDRELFLYLREVAEDEGVIFPEGIYKMHQEGFFVFLVVNNMTYKYCIAAKGSRTPLLDFVCRELTMMLMLTMLTS